MVSLREKGTNTSTLILGYLRSQDESKFLVKVGTLDLTNKENTSGFGYFLSEEPSEYLCDKDNKTCRPQKWWLSPFTYSVRLSA